MQLSSVKQQHSTSQETVKQKEGQLEKLQVQLKTTQGSFEEELKRLKGQISTLEQTNAKKASDIFKWKRTHLIVHPWLKTFNVFLNVSLTLLQAEEESELRAQVSGLGQELAAEKSQTTELQKALEQSQESHTKLQSDLYGKESEVSALHQDLEVGRGDSDGIAAFGENDLPPSSLSERANERVCLCMCRGHRRN